MSDYGAKLRDAQKAEADKLKKDREDLNRLHAEQRAEQQKRAEAWFNNVLQHIKMQIDNNKVPELTDMSQKVNNNSMHNVNVHGHEYFTLWQKFVSDLGSIGLVPAITINSGKSVMKINPL